MMWEKPPRRSGTSMSAPVSGGGTRNNSGVAVPLTLETAGRAAHAVTHDDNICAHLLQGVGEAETFLVHSLVHDRCTLSLGQRHNKGLLPVGHEAGVHIGLKDNGFS